jgi:conjugative transfer signal peptidase TraF
MSTRISCRVAIFGTLAGVALLLASAAGVQPLIVWNATASAPIGFYRVLPSGRGPLRNGELVLVQLDTPDAHLYAGRGYLPFGVPLLKRIAATTGQLVCEQNGKLSIDGRHVADALPADGRGQPLIPWHGCRLLQEGEVFLLMADIPASLDGRYLGPTPVRSVLGRAVPLWTAEAH